MELSFFVCILNESQNAVLVETMKAQELVEMR